jgi:sugar transferase (PEP-CTERM system associated)
MSIKIFRHNVHLPIVFLMLLEAGMAVLALQLIAALLSGGARSPDWEEYTLFAGILGLSLGAMGLYNPRLRERKLGLAVRLVLAALAAGIILSALVPLLSQVDIAPARFAVALAVAVAGDCLVRFIYAGLLREDFYKRRVLVYGAGRQAASIAGLKRRTDRIGFVIVGFLRADADEPAVSADRIIDPSADLVELCERHDVDEIVVAMDDRRRAFPLHDLLQCRLNGVRVCELLDFLDRETGKIRLDLLNPSWMIYSDGFQRSALREFAGRLLDIGAALAVLAVTWPVMLLAAIAIKIEDGIGAPVLYRQRRVGFRGEVFELLKFRSMTTSAEADGVARWATRDDKRVTRVGSFMRKTRIDELPQLLNVLKGDMRFVGPRPERPEFVEQLAERIPYYRERHCVKPGLTGWAQLCYPYGASEADAVEKLQYDLYYLKNRSLVFDIAVLIQTVEVVLFGKGAR